MHWRSLSSCCLLPVAVGLTGVILAGLVSAPRVHTRPAPAVAVSSVARGVHHVSRVTALTRLAAVTMLPVSSGQAFPMFCHGLDQKLLSPGAVCDSDERNKECSNYDNCPALSVPGRCQVSSLIIRNAGKLEEVQTNTDTHTKTRQSC